MTVKVAVLAPAAMATEAGVESRVLLLERVTAVALVADLLKLTVQRAEALETRVTGEQARDERVRAEARLIVAVFETPPRVAVKVAD